MESISIKIFLNPKKPKRLDMVNTKLFPQFSFSYSAMSAFIIIAVACISSLLQPIRAIVRAITPSPMEILFSITMPGISHPNRFAFYGTEIMFIPLYQRWRSKQFLPTNRTINRAPFITRVRCTVRKIMASPSVGTFLITKIMKFPRPHITRSFLCEFTAIITFYGYPFLSLRLSPAFHGTIYLIYIFHFIKWTFANRANSQMRHTYFTYCWPFTHSCISLSTFPTNSHHFITQLYHKLTVLSTLVRDTFGSIKACG